MTSGIDFVLEPYPGLPFPEGVRVTGAARRGGSVLSLSWKLDGPSETLAVAPMVTLAERRDGLWEQTCFEFFLACPDRPGYREFNLSPAGHWNVYRFDGYRAGMTEETALGALPFTVSTHARGYELVADIDLTGLAIACEPWTVAISTVVLEPRGRISYWALSHPGSEPDFHHPDAFQLRLDPARN